MTDAERIERIHAWVRARPSGTGIIRADHVAWLLDRLAAVERERDAYKGISDTYLTEAGLRTKERDEARAGVEQMKDGYNATIKEMAEGWNADRERIARLEAENAKWRREHLGMQAVVEAARALLSICVELAPSPAAHLGARMGRLGLALAALDEEKP